MLRLKLCTGAAPFESVLGRSEAFGSPSVIVRGGAAMSGENQVLSGRDVSSYEETRAPNQGGRYEAAYERIARRFGELGVPEECIVPAVVDPLAAIVADERLSFWRLFDMVVDASTLIDHPSTRVMAAVATMTSDGARPVIPTAPFIDGVARAYADEFGVGGSWFNSYPSGLRFACV